MLTAIIFLVLGVLCVPVAFFGLLFTLAAGSKGELGIMAGAAAVTGLVGGTGGVLIVYNLIQIVIHIIDAVKYV